MTADTNTTKTARRTTVSEVKSTKVLLPKFVRRFGARSLRTIPQPGFGTSGKDRRDRYNSADTGCPRWALATPGPQAPSGRDSRGSQAICHQLVPSGSAKGRLRENPRAIRPLNLGNRVELRRWARSEHTQTPQHKPSPRSPGQSPAARVSFTMERRNHHQCWHPAMPPL